MNQEDAEEFTQSLGQIVSGSWRQIALANRLGVPQALGMKLDEWVKERLGGYARLSKEDRQEAVLELTQGGHSKPEIAVVLGVGEATVGRDRAISNDTDDQDNIGENNELDDDVVSNDTPSPDFGDLGKHDPDSDPDAQSALVGADPKDSEKKDPDSLNRQQEKASRRAKREAELAEKQNSLPDKRYGVILADPEWRFEPYSRETGMDRAADNHYPTNTTDVIASRPVVDIAADDCVLFLWATVPMLQDALSVMGAWGFEYRSLFVWDKIHIGTGYWNRNRCELLLLGTRGHVPAPEMGKQFPSVLQIARREHSAKPEQFSELVEEYFPNLPKIELNRRGPPRPGWDAWGNELEPDQIGGLEDAFGVVDWDGADAIH